MSQGSQKGTAQHLHNLEQDSQDSGASASPDPPRQQPVIIVACVESADDVAPSLRRCFTHELQVEAPDAPARKRLLQVRLMYHGLAHIYLHL